MIIGALLDSAKKVASVAASASVTGWALPGKASERLSSGVVRQGGRGGRCVSVLGAHRCTSGFAGFNQGWHGLGSRALKEAQR